MGLLLFNCNVLSKENPKQTTNPKPNKIKPKKAPQAPFPRRTKPKASDDVFSPSVSNKTCQYTDLDMYSSDIPEKIIYNLSFP